MNAKQRSFVEHYLQSWSGTAAARAAGYAHPNVQATRLLANVSIRAEIQRRLDELCMTADEALVRLADQARGAYAEFINENGQVDLAAMKAAGKMHLIKRIKTRELVDGQTLILVDDIEFVDSQAALFKIGQHHKLFVERIEANVALRVEGLDALLDKIYGSTES